MPSCSISFHVELRYDVFVDESDRYVVANNLAANNNARGVLGKVPRHAL